MRLLPQVLPHSNQVAQPRDNPFRKRSHTSEANSLTKGSCQQDLQTPAFVARSYARATCAVVLRRRLHTELGHVPNSKLPARYIRPLCGKRQPLFVGQTFPRGFLSNRSARVLPCRSLRTDVNCSPKAARPRDDSEQFSLC